MNMSQVGKEKHSIVADLRMTACPEGLLMTAVVYHEALQTAV